MFIACIVVPHFSRPGDYLSWKMRLIPDLDADPARQGEVGQVFMELCGEAVAFRSVNALLLAIGRNSDRAGRPVKAVDSSAAGSTAVTAAGAARPGSLRYWPR